MRYLIFLLCSFPGLLSAQTTVAPRAAQHTAARQATQLNKLPTELSRAGLRYTESLTEGDARTQAVSREQVEKLMAKSIELHNGQTAANQRKLLELFQRYAADDSPESRTNAARVLQDFERSLKVTGDAKTGAPVID